MKSQFRERLYFQAASCTQAPGEHLRETVTLSSAVLQGRCYPYLACKETGGDPFTDIMPEASTPSSDKITKMKKNNKKGFKGCRQTEDRQRAQSL